LYNKSYEDKPNARKKENMAVRSLVDRKEIGEMAFRRRFNAIMDPANGLISASMACRWYSRGFSWLESIIKRFSFGDDGNQMVL
jgi:hypothetical protein